MSSPYGGRAQARARSTDDELKAIEERAAAQLHVLEQAAYVITDHQGTNVGRMRDAIVDVLNKSRRSDVPWLANCVRELQAERDAAVTRAERAEQEATRCRAAMNSVLDEGPEWIDRRNRAIEQRDAAIARAAEVEAQAAVMREALMGAYVHIHDRNASDGRCEVCARRFAAIDSDVGRALLAEVAALRKVAEAANRAVRKIDGYESILGPLGDALDELDSLGGGKP